MGGWVLKAPSSRWEACLQAMIAPVEGVSFNVLDKARSMEWKGIRLRFGRDADDIKLATRDLIDTCFRYAEQG